MASFGDKVKSLRESQGFSQQQLSDKAGISQAAIAAYELNKKVPSLDSAVCLARALNVRMDWLCGNENAGQILPSYADVVEVVDSIQNSIDAEIMADGESVMLRITSRELVDYYTKRAAFRKAIEAAPNAYEMFEVWDATAREALRKCPVPVVEVQADEDIH